MIYVHPLGVLDICRSSSARRTLRNVENVHTAAVTKRVKNHFKFKPVTKRETVRISVPCYIRCGTAGNEMSKKLLGLLHDFAVGPAAVSVNRSTRQQIRNDRV